MVLLVIASKFTQTHQRQGLLWLTFAVAYVHLSGRKVGLLREIDYMASLKLQALSLLGNRRFRRITDQSRYDTHRARPCEVCGIEYNYASERSFMQQQSNVDIRLLVLDLPNTDYGKR